MPPATTPVRIAPVIIGILLTIILLAGLAYISNLRRNSPSSAPALTIISPAQGAQIDSPLVLRFTSAQPIALRASGWGAGQYHLHAHVNSVEHMPAATDITRQGSEYTWAIPAAPRGPLTIRLGWADLQHRAIVSGASDTVHAAMR
jgi:hypothetical protein